MLYIIKITYFSLFLEKEKKNAFKFPNSADSHFPQYKKQDLIDFRSSSIPFAGTEFSGAYRKKKNLEKDIEKPEIEVEEIKEEEDIEVISENIEENVDIDDLDFEKIKISGKKKIKKSDQEKGIIYFKTKEIQRKKHEKKKQRSCKKSRKSMKF